MTAGDERERAVEKPASTADILSRSEAITSEFDRLLDASEALLKLLKRDGQK